MKCILAVIVALFLVPLAAGQTSYSGTLAADTTMSGACTIEANLTVPAGITLTISPGATVKLRAGVSILVSGRLLADGTEAQPILLTSYGSTSSVLWKQIKFTQAADSRFSWCTLEYANCGGDHKASYYNNRGPRNYYECVVVVASHVDFDHCTFQKLHEGSAHSGDAVSVFSDDDTIPGIGSATVSSCKFLSVGQGIYTMYSYVLVEDCYFQGKTGDNDDVDLYGESTPACLIRRNLFDLPCDDDRIHPTKCSAIIMNNVIKGSTDSAIVLRDRCDPIVMNNIMSNCPTSGIAIQNTCNALIVNNTIVNCSPAIKCLDFSDRWGAPYYLTPGSGSATVINCIFWHSSTMQSFNLADSPSNSPNPDKGAHVKVSYCDIKGGKTNFSKGTNSTLDWGDGIINTDPLFADMTNKDFHLKSQAGRWNPTTLSWVKDAVTSPCIDAGDPASDWRSELWPNGGRINLGGYGGTPEASMSTNTAVGKLADIDQDGSINLFDLSRLAQVWMLDDRLSPANLDRMGTIDLADLALFATEWLQ
jgi:hypothetical protein